MRLRRPRPCAQATGTNKSKMLEAYLQNADRCITKVRPSTLSPEP